MKYRQRDFYFIRDRLPLCWAETKVETQKAQEGSLDEIRKSLDVSISSLQLSYPDQSNFILDLSLAVRGCHDKALLDLAKLERSDLEIGDPELKMLDVSLSTSSIGFLSAEELKDGTTIRMTIALDSVEAHVNILMSVVDSRVSSDPENKGYWIRCRFLSEQRTAIDAIMAHITLRQSERLLKD
ncbi:hypothetical protein N9W66_10975 [Luminiphilus sp.]|nr:hypothetical protein [Luminiphilus sp.]